MLRKLLPVLAALALVATGCRWSAYRHDPGLTGFNDTDSIVNGSNGANLVSRFTVAVGWTGPALVAGNVIVAKDANGGLWGADDAGAQGCSGVPSVCQPRWTAPTNDPDSWASARGWVVFTTYRPVVNGRTRIAAYDSSAGASCTGSPKVCSPLWTTDNDSDTFGGATLAGDLLYTTDGAELRVYDATGEQSCAGVPKVCSPLWTAPTFFAVGHPAVAGGKVYVPDHQGFVVFDAAGQQGCSGAPKVCQPLWAGNLGSLPGSIQATDRYVVTIRTLGQPPFGGQLDVTDATASLGCTAGVCRPLWTTHVEATKGLPAVANGRVYVQQGLGQSRAEAYDLRGQTNCSGVTLPVTCTALWTTPLGVEVPVVGADATAVSDIVFFERYDGTSNEVPDGDLYVVALDQATGVRRFATPANHGFTPPTVGDGRLYLPSSAGIEVFALP